MPKGKKKNEKHSSKSENWLCVGIFLEQLARLFTTVPFPACLEPEGQSKVKASGLFRTFLSIYPALGMCVVLSIP